MSHRVASGAALVFSAVVALGCATHSPKPIGVSGNPDFPSYQPIHPITVWLDPESVDTTTPQLQEALLNDLANSSSLFAVTQVHGSAGGAYGPAAATVEGRSYRATYDYVIYHTLSTPIQVYSAESDGGRSFEVVPLAEEEAAEAPACWRLEYAGPVPVYVGVGVRIQVDFTSLASNISVGSLSTLGLEAEADRLAGSLSAQTLGVTSRQISALMPVESELSLAAIQRVIEAVAAIKSNIYAEGNVAVPQILGFQSPLGRPGAVAALARYVYGLDYQIETVAAGDGKVGITWPPLAASQPASTIGSGCPTPAASG